MFADIQPWFKADVWRSPRNKTQRPRPVRTAIKLSRAAWDAQQAACVNVQIRKTPYFNFIQCLANMRKVYIHAIRFTQISPKYNVTLQHSIYKPKNCHYKAYFTSAHTNNRICWTLKNIMNVALMSQRQTHLTMRQKFSLCLHLGRLWSPEVNCIATKSICE